jgi:hypothetical protein
MRPRNRILWITFLSTIVLAGRAVVIVKHVSRSQVLPVSRVEGLGEQSELRQFAQLVGRSGHRQPNPFAWNSPQ